MGMRLCGLLFHLFHLILIFDKLYRECVYTAAGESHTYIPLIENPLKKVKQVKQYGLNPHNNRVCRCFTYLEIR